LGTILLFHFVRCDDNAHVTVQLLVENSRCFNTLNQAAVATVRAVAPAGVTVEEHLHALSAWVMEVTNSGFHQGAARALAAT
jgi:hypothetical protein